MATSGFEQMCAKLAGHIDTLGEIVGSARCRSGNDAKSGVKDASTERLAASRNKLHFDLLCILPIDSYQQSRSAEFIPKCSIGVSEVS